MNENECNLKIGETLTRKAFTDAAGKHYPADPDLTVESITRETCAETGNAFWRVSAGNHRVKCVGPEWVFEGAR